MQRAVRAPDGLVPETGQAHALGRLNDEQLHTDRLAGGAPGLARRHGGPAGRGDRGQRTGPGSGKTAPELIHAGIGHQIIRIGVGFIMKGIDADNQRQIAGVFQTFAHRLFEPAVAVERIALPVDPAFVFEGIAVGMRQQMFGGHVGRREGEPGIFRRIRIFTGRDLLFELRGLLIRCPATDGRKALGSTLPFEGQQIIARPLEGCLVVAPAAPRKGRL